MNRGSFLKALATIVVAPAILYIDPKRVPITEPGKEWMGLMFRVPTDMYKHDPQSLQNLIFEQMSCYKIDHKKPYILQQGWNNDDFERDMATITIKQETKYLLPS